MKKILALILSIGMCFAFTGCDYVGCSLCNDGEEIRIHETWSYDELYTTATCTEDGTTTIRCAYCKKYTTEIETKALGHDYKITKDEATCLKDGNTYYACQRENCSEEKVEFSKASQSKHKWKEVSSRDTIQYTYTDWKCSICQKTQTDKIPVNKGTSIRNTKEEFYYATASAIRIVKEQLKYPSSARFIQESQMEVHYNSLTSYSVRYS